MNKKFAVGLVVLLAGLPLVGLAGFNPGDVPATNENLTVFSLIDTIISFVWPVIMIAVVLLFLFGVFAAAQGGEEKAAQARMAFIWGVAGMVVIFLAWSIPFIVRNTLGV